MRHGEEPGNATKTPWPYARLCAQVGSLVGCAHKPKLKTRPRGGPGLNNQLQLPHLASPLGQKPTCTTALACRRTRLAFGCSRSMSMASLAPSPPGRLRSMSMASLLPSPPPVARLPASLAATSSFACQLALRTRTCRWPFSALSTARAIAYHQQS